eukprot:scaffold513104_cov20-Prasinocladus_malaysianus.AAC.1
MATQKQISLPLTNTNMHSCIEAQLGTTSSISNNEALHNDVIHTVCFLRPTPVKYHNFVRFLLNIQEPQEALTVKSNFDQVLFL